jgi:lysozyme
MNAVPKIKQRIKARPVTNLVGATAMLCCTIVGGFEGIRLNAYRDVVGVPTICYGETRGVKISDKATKAECDEMLISGLKDFEQGAYNCNPALAEAPGKRIVAHVSLAYNIGIGAYCKSTVVRRFKEGDIEGSCNAFLMWNKAKGITFPGLTRRREAERKLCLEAA